MTRRRLGEILHKAGVLEPSGLRAALAEQQKWGGQLGRILIDMKLINEEVLVKALSHQLNIPIVHLDHIEIPERLLGLVPGDLAEQLGIVPFKLEGKFLDVAMSDPTNLGIIDELRIRTRLTVRPHISGPKEIERALAKHYGRGAGLVQQQAAMHGRGEFSAPEELELQKGRMIDAEAIAASNTDTRTAEIRALQQRISTLEALVARDEDVLRKVLGLLVEKGLATREEIYERIK